MIFLIIISVLIITLYFYGVRTFDYWQKRGVKYVKPVPFMGTYYRQFFQKVSMGVQAAETYNDFPNEKVVGVFRGTCPELVIRDPEVAKRILVIDAQHFLSRGFNPHKTVIEPLFKNLFFADGDLWKLLRQRFTSLFSTAKLKAMFPFITQRAEKLQIIAEDICKLDHYDARELFARYTTDFVGACGFGIDMDALNDENSQFRKLGKRIFQRTIKDAIRGALKLTFTDLCKHVSFLDDEIEKSMEHLVTTVMQLRNYKPSGKNDFIDLLLELKSKGKVIGESVDERNPDGTSKVVSLEMTDLLMTAQVFVFFAAGYETSSTASSYTLHQLAFNPEYQEKVQAEIDTITAKYGNAITYEAVKEMSYLELAFYESMRMYPSVAYLVRMCCIPEYTIPEIDLTIHEGVKIMIPIKAMQNDPNYFANPDKFDPERFKDGAAKDYIKNFVYLPFGEGPKACVGARLGQMQSMAGLAAILQKFTVEPAACSVRDPLPDPTGTVAEGFINGLPLKFRKRDLKT